MQQWEKYIDLAIDALVFYVPKVVLALVLLWIGFKIAKKVGEAARNALRKAKINESIVPFFGSMAEIAIKVVVLLFAASTVGIETASLVAVLAAAGFAIGLALQGSLGNFAAGIIVMVFKPYKIGDFIEVADKFGQVIEIQVFNTLLVTPGQKTLVIPNGKIVEGVVTNYSMNGITRLELRFNLPHSSNLGIVKRIVLEALSPLPEVNSEMITEIGIEDFGDHGFILLVRPWVKPEMYWEARFRCLEAIRLAFHNHDVEMAVSDDLQMVKVGP